MGISPGKRLRLFRDTLGLSQRKFAISLGVSGGTIGSIESGISEPSRKFLQTISDRYDINSDWLLNGHGEMHRPTKPGFMPSNPTEPRINPPDYTVPHGGSFSIDGHNFGLIRRFDVRVSAGMGVGVQADNIVDQIAFSRSWMAERGLTSDLSGIVMAKGISMEPMIPDGAQMLVRFDVFAPYPSGIYIFRYKDELFVKHLTVLDVDPIQRPLRILLSSQNPAVAPRVIEIDEEAAFKIIGKVVSVIADLD